MNKARRKELQEVLNQIEELKGTLEDIQSEEEECRDNIPESLQQSERYERVAEACDHLEEAVFSNLEEAIDNIGGAIGG